VRAATDRLGDRLMQMRLMRELCDRLVVGSADQIGGDLGVRAAAGKRDEASARSLRLIPASVLTSRLEYQTWGNAFILIHVAAIFSRLQVSIRRITCNTLGESVRARFHDFI